MPIVGRTVELAALERVLRDSAGPRVLILQGPAGIGKTAVWDAGMRAARDTGTAVWSARPSAAEVTFAFGALADLLHAVPENRFEALPDVQRIALESALLRVHPVGNLQTRTIGTALLGVLRAAARQGPVVIGIDDAQWIDPSSDRALEFALRRLDVEDVSVLVGMRAGEKDRPPRFLGAFSDGRRTRVDVGPLDPSALITILQDRIETPLPRPVTLRIVRASRGNPLAAIEVAREVERSGTDLRGPLPAPADLRATVAARLRRLPRPTRDALLVAAAASRPTTRLLAAADLEPAEAAGVVRLVGDRVEFVHPLFGEALYASARPAQRRDAHLRLADLLDDPEERASHRALATTEPDADVASALDVAAEHARRRIAFDAAAELLDHAVQLTPLTDRDLRVGRAIRSARYHLLAGDRRRARALVESLLGEVPAGAARVDALLVLADVAQHDENFPAALAALDEASAMAVGAQLVETLLDAAYVRCNLGDLVGAVATVAHAQSTASEVRDTGLTADVTALRVMTDYLVGRGVDWESLAAAVAAEDPSRLTRLARRPRCIDALLRAYVGETDLARERLLTLLRACEDLGDESDAVILVLWVTWLAVQTGDLAAAEGWIARLRRLCVLVGATTAETWVVTMEAAVGAHRGAVATTIDACDRAVELALRAGFLLPLIWITAMRTLVYLGDGDPASAWSAAEPLVTMVEATGVTEPVAALFLPDAVEALVALGEYDRADAILAPFEARSEKLGRVWGLAAGGRARGVLAAARGDLDGAEAAFARSLAALEPTPFRFERARTWLERGRVERRRRKLRTARELLRAAADEFDAVDAPAWAAIARAEAERTHPSQAPGELTPTELQIARLAVDGMTNQAIAQRLHISLKTVETNLTRVYRKLGVRGRVQLATALAERE